MEALSTPGRGRASIGRRRVGQAKRVMEVPQEWLDYECRDHFDSPLAERGWWDEDGQCWYIQPATRLREAASGNFLVIGGPGVGGIEWGYRKGKPGIWVHYSIEDEFVLIADTVAELQEGYDSGRIRV